MGKRLGEKADIINLRVFVVVDEMLASIVLFCNVGDQW
jgi:hypothetical protein